ncbi:MAG: response regulator [Chitinophagaceae bacterium]|nr:response regulator [Chitinophagaceae bacterium]
MKNLIRVLQVDDDVEDFLIIQDLLSDIETQSYSIEWSPGYDDALKKIEENIYDILLIDFMLGTSTGIELLKEVRKKNPNIPVIIFTGQGDERVDLEAMNAGASDYLVKGQIDSNILERSMRYSIKQAQTQEKLLGHEQNLRMAEKFALTGRMAQVIAHEIRNPLTNVKLALQQLQDELTNPSESILTLIEMIDRNCNRINQLIINLLNSTKSEKLNYEDLSINALIDETLELAHDRLELKKIKIEKKYSDDICDVYVDREQVKIALLNIIINAIEAVEEERGKLIFTTEGKGDKCVVTISDNGKGMAPDELDKIFEAYYTGKSKGIGLGLTTTQSIILSHKGNIKVESRVNSGTTFIITFDFSPHKWKPEPVFSFQK